MQSAVLVMGVVGGYRVPSSQLYQQDRDRYKRFHFYPSCEVYSYSIEVVSFSPIKTYFPALRVCDLVIIRAGFFLLYCILFHGNIYKTSISNNHPNDELSFMNQECKSATELRSEPCEMWAQLVEVECLYAITHEKQQIQLYIDLIMQPDFVLKYTCERYCSHLQGSFYCIVRDYSIDVKTLCK